MRILSTSFLETIQENDVSQNDIYSVISDCKPDEEHSDTPLNKNSINVTCPFDGTLSKQLNFDINYLNNFV